MLHLSAPQHGRSLDHQAGYEPPELLESYPPGPIPEGSALVDADSVAAHLKQLRTYASDTINPELSEDRTHRWRQEVSCAPDLFDWMTLMALDDLNTWSAK